MPKSGGYNVDLEWEIHIIILSKHFCLLNSSLGNYRNWFVTQYITYLISDVLCYKPIPIIYRTSLLQNSLKVIILSRNLKIKV
jgi:hypothetical protein